MGSAGLTIRDGVFKTVQFSCSLCPQQSLLVMGGSRAGTAPSTSDISICSGERWSKKKWDNLPLCQEIKDLSLQDRQTEGVLNLALKDNQKGGREEGRK